MFYNSYPIGEPSPPANASPKYKLKTPKNIGLKIVAVMWFIITLVVTPLYIMDLNLSTQQKISQHLKNCPTERIPVIINSIYYNKWRDDWRDIDFSAINKSDNVPFEHLKISGTQSANWVKKLKKGDTLVFRISLEYPNLCDLRNTNGDGF